MDLKTLENWLWESACVIRGPIEAPKYKEYILPLIFLKRLSDVFEDEVEELGFPMEVIEKEPQLVSFFVPKKARWSYISKQTKNLGEVLTDAVREVVKHNRKLHGVIDIVDYNATTAGERILPDDVLRRLIKVLSKHRLGRKDVEPDILGRAYEYLIRKFAEGSGQSAGEFYTLFEVGMLMAYLLDPEPGDEIYDPTCGSGGLLVKSYLRFEEKYGKKGENGRVEIPKNIKKPKFYGQDIEPTAYAMANMNMIIHNMEAEIRLGDTMRKPAFREEDGSLKRFTKVIANPMWNQEFPKEVYENDPFGRFKFGYPPSSSADWGWIQHMFASLKENGKLVIVIDTGAVSRGSGKTGRDKERDIRKAFVERGFIEAVILLPDNLFYNAAAPGVIIVIRKKERENGEVLVINAQKAFVKGKPKNRLPQELIPKIYEIYRERKEVKPNDIPIASKLVSLEEIRENDYNLSPNKYAPVEEEEEVLPLDEAIVRLKEAEEERKEAEENMLCILSEIGIDLR